jgi:hypothetical protein
MTDSVETICNLPEEELRARIEVLRRDLLPHVRGATALPGAAGVSLEFDATSALREQLEQLVEFERRCCGGLQWTLHTKDPQSLKLSIEGAAPDSAFFARLGIEIAQHEPRDEPTPRDIADFAKAGGVGVSVAFVLFCVLPIGLAAAGGATLAAWLGPLDHPAVVLLGGAAFAIPAWRMLHRKRTSS